MTQQNNKVWFITGASRGFGRVWTEAALERGDKVAATARNRKSIADLNEKFKDNVLTLELDVTRPDQVKDAVAKAYEHFGRLDIVLGNVGENFYLQPTKEEPVKLWVSDFDHNDHKNKIIPYTVNGKDMPVFLKNDLQEQLPGIKNRNLKHKQYAET